jgi:hypothetical protein
MTIFSIAPDFFAVFEQVISLESVKKHAHNGGTWNRHDPVFQCFLKGEKMKNGKFLFLAAASLMLAACGGNNAVESKGESKAPVVKNGEAFGLVHGAGYVGYATVTTTDGKITAATLTEYCFPSYVTADAAEEGKTVDIEVTAHGATSTKHFYKEVKFGTYTLTIDAEAKGYKTADGKTEKALFADDAAAKAWKEAIVAGNVEVNGVKTIMTNDKLCKDKNGYGGTNFDWKGNRDKTVAAFIEHGKALENATYNADAKKWSLNDVELGATWTDLNTRKEGSLSYVELLVKALNAVK